MAAGALAYLITGQQDAAGLVLYDEDVRRVLPAQSNQAHLRAIFNVLEAAEPHGTTGTGRALGRVSESVRRRGIILLFSDLLDDEREVMRGLRSLRQRGHEVVLFHLLAEDEVNFPFQRMTRFEGLEELSDLTADPVSVREAYLAEVQRFRKNLRRVCLANQIDLIEMDTGDSLGVVLAAYLAKRAARRGR